MATVPVPRTWTTGETVTATIMNATTGVKGAHDFMLSPPRCYIYQTAVTNMPTSGTAALMLFDTELYDTDTMHSTVSNTGRITSNATGLYRISGCIGFASNATGYRQVNVRKNAAGSAAGGTSICVARIAATPTLAAQVMFSVDVQLTATDYVEVFATNSSGGALDSVAGQANTYMSAIWIANS